MPQASRRICVGKITVPHGLRGLVKIKSFTESPTAIGCFSQLHDEAGQRVDISIISVQKAAVIARIEGVSERTQAEAWSGKPLYVLRSDLPLLPAEEYYCADLIGLRAVQENGCSVGVVCDVHDFGAGGVLEIKRDRKPDLMLSFNSETVLEVDMRECRVILAAAAVNPGEDN